MIWEKLKHVVSELHDSTKPRWFDYAYVIFIIVVSVPFFCHNDIDITARHSYDMLSIIKNGNTFSFYQITWDKALGGGYANGASAPVYSANYNILIYLALAIWLFPLKVLGSIFHFVPSRFVLNTYSKLLLVVVLILSVWIFKKVTSFFILDEHRICWGSYLFLTSPILLYSVTLFSQLDIISIFFTLWALKFYMEKKYYHFSILMSIGACFKIFSMLVFVPLILLVFKKIFVIIKHMLIGVSLLVLTKLLGYLDSGYAITRDFMETYYGFTSRLFHSEIPGPFGGMSAFVFSFAILCIIAYFIKPDDEKRKKYAVVFPLVSYSLFFMLISWHPQWVSILSPFIVLSILLIPDVRTALFIDIGITFSFVLLLFCGYGNHVTVGLTERGLLPSLTGKIANIPEIRQIPLPFPIKSISSSLFAAALVSFLAIVLFSLLNKRYSDNVNAEKVTRGVVFTRTSLMLFLIILPSFVLHFLY